MRIDYYSRPNHATSLAELLDLARLNRENINYARRYCRKNEGNLSRAYEMQNMREVICDNRVHYSCILRNIDRLLAEGCPDKRSARLARAICEKGYNSNAHAR